jgi:RNA polymerase sigma-70 factor (ECF subfamily)
MTNEPTTLTDETIVRRVLQGDTPAYRLLVERYQNLVFACARAITGNDADAQDAAQEAFIRLYRHLSQFDPRRPLKPYLMRIAVNCSRNITGTRRGWDPLEETGEIPVAPADVTEPERHAAVREMVERLPATLREVCALFYFAEHSCKEVAEILQMNETAVKVALHRARKKLLTDWRCAYE